MTTKPPVRVDFTPRFLKKLKQLTKKYPNTYNDIRVLIDQLENGETPGDQIKGVSRPVYKVRVRNTDVQKGKSGARS